MTQDCLEKEERQEILGIQDLRVRQELLDLQELPALLAVRDWLVYQDH